MQRKEVGRNVEPHDASKLKVGIVASRFNTDITDAMLNGARAVLSEWGVPENRTHVARVYGSFEIPLAASKLVKRHKLDLVIAIGCIIKGETRHDEYLAHAVADGLMDLQLETGAAVGFGVITTNSLEQARARSSGETNHGAQAARAALEAALI